MDEDSWRTWVSEYLAGRNDATLPEQGWPWPWEDSRTTDYAYAWDDGVWVSSCGRPWRTSEQALDPEYDDGDSPKMGADAFPNMKHVQNVTMGKRSGAIFLTLGGPVEDE